MNGFVPVFIELPERGLIKVSGHDRFEFLQGLITNDVNLLKTQDSLYSCLLTPNGKFLFDFFITEDKDKILIDCEGGERAESLLKRLQMFKLRADVNFEIETKRNIYALLHTKTNNSWPDPRHLDIGQRTFEKPKNIKQAPFEFWDKHRIKLSIPDGSRDMIPEKSTLLECGIDNLNGVSFEKGCYMGQELTARMHYRGLTKKALYAVEFTEKPPVRLSEIKDTNDKLIGEMRSSCGRIGLALLKKDSIQENSSLPFTLLSSA